MHHLTSLALAATLIAGCNGGDPEESGTDSAPVDDSGATTDTSDSGETGDTAEPTLFDQLGGSAGVNAVLDAFLANVVADAEINWFFADTDAAQLKVALHDQICEATGGGCVYLGENMKDAHEGMAITDAQFNALVGDLLAALDSLEVPYTAPNFDGGLPADQLITALAGMKSDIVEDPAGDQVYFNKLGGHAAVTAVIDEFVGNVAENPEINARFATTDIAMLKHHLVDQVCEATGGACDYTGRDMKTAHMGMCITDAEFNSLVGDLLEALDTLQVPYTAGTYDQHVGADDLILALAGMKGDIVENCP